MNPTDLDALAGYFSGLSMVVGLLVKAEAQRQPNPQAWAATAQARCIEALRTVEGEHLHAKGAERWLDVSLATVVEVFRPLVQTRE